MLELFRQCGIFFSLNIPIRIFATSPPPFFLVINNTLKLPIRQLNIDWPLVYTNSISSLITCGVSNYKWPVKISTFLATIYLKGVTINKKKTRVAQWIRSLDLTTHASLSPLRRGFAPRFGNNKKGELDSQPQVIKFISWLPMIGGSLRVLRLPPPLKQVAMI